MPADQGLNQGLDVLLTNLDLDTYGTVFSNVNNGYNALMLLSGNMMMKVCFLTITADTMPAMPSGATGPSTTFRRVLAAMDAWRKNNTGQLLLNIANGNSMGRDEHGILSHPSLYEMTDMERMHVLQLVCGRMWRWSDGAWKQDAPTVMVGKDQFVWLHLMEFAMEHGHEDTISTLLTHTHYEGMDLIPFRFSRDMSEEIQALIQEKLPRAYVPVQ